jgi:hypothetical protein
MSSFSQLVTKWVRSQKPFWDKPAKPTSSCKFQLVWSKIMSHPACYFKNTEAASMFFPEPHYNWNYTCTLRQNVVLVHKLYIWLPDWVVLIKRMYTSLDHRSVLPWKYWQKFLTIKSNLLSAVEIWSVGCSLKWTLTTRSNDFSHWCWQNF